MSNPKGFYNQPDYSGEEIGSSSPNSARPPNALGQKPNQLSSPELLPPYSPDLAGRSSNDGSSEYGSVRNSIDPDEEQRVGLLNQQEEPSSSFPEQSRDRDRDSGWKYANPQQDFPAYNSNPPSSSLMQQQRQQPVQRFAFPFNTRGAQTDPGCCRKWCKYIFLALLVSLVFFKYSNHLPGYPSYDDICSVKAVGWEDLPRSISFENNLEVIMLGQVHYGQITIVPIEDRSGGSIISDVRVYPESLQSKLSHQVESDNGITRLTMEMPQYIDYDKECITVSMEIRLPYGADILRLDVKSLDIKVLHPFVKDLKTLDVRTTNSAIEVGRWTGDSIKLITDNGDLKVGSLKSGGAIYLQTTNGDLSLSGNIVAKRTVTLKNNNGEIESFALIQSEEDAVDVDTDNSLIQLTNVKADYVSLKSSNKGITVKHIDAKVQALAKTSNGPVSLSVGGAKNNQVNIATVNAEIDLHMSNEFEGSFLLSTTNADVYVPYDEEIRYIEDRDYLKRGTRKGSGNKGDLTVQNNNGNIMIDFEA